MNILQLFTKITSCSICGSDVTLESDGDRLHYYNCAMCYCGEKWAVIDPVRSSGEKDTVLDWLGLFPVTIEESDYA